MHLPIQLDRTRDEALQNQLFEQMRGLIISGQLKPNTRIIATRFLSEQLGVSRTTVLLAYERLISEGYLETRPAVGTFVSAALPDDALDARPARQAEAPPEQTGAPPSGLTIQFSATPSFGAFPFKSWQKISNALLERHGAHPAWQNGRPAWAGLDNLRAVIAEWLAFHKGIVADPEQVVIVNGPMQAMVIAATLFLKNGARVAVERPGDLNAAELFEGHGGMRVEVPVDEHGLMVERLPAGRIRLVHVSPSRQRPLGCTMPMERRERLLKWASDADAIILEDDSDGDFRYRGSAPSPLFSLDRDGRVIYLRRFSDTLGPGTRLAYMVVPSEMIADVRRAKARLDSGSPWLEQATLAEFIATGEYDRHLRVVRKTYLERQETLVACLTRHFGDVRLLGTDSGTDVAWLLPDGLPPAEIVRDLAARHGIGVAVPRYRPSRDTDLTRRLRNVLLLGYAGLDEASIVKGIDELGEMLSQANPARLFPESADFRRATA